MNSNSTTTVVGCTQITVMNCIFGGLSVPGGGYIVIVTAYSGLEQNQAQNFGNTGLYLFRFMIPVGLFFVHLLLVYVSKLFGLVIQALNGYL